MIDPITGAAVATAATVAPKVYRDALQPAAKEVGKTFQSAGKLVSAVFGRGFDIAAENVNNFYDNFAKNVKDKSDQIPEAERIEPSLGLIYSVQQSCTVAIESQTLQQIFENLVVGAMDRRTAQGILPVHAEILRQLTSDEAKILKLIHKKGRLPLISVRSDIKNQDGAGHTVYENFSLFGKEAKCDLLANMPVYIDNLCRLQITTIPEFSQLASKELYEPLKNSLFILNLKTKIESSGNICTIQEKYLQITPFGRSLCSACQIDSVDTSIP